MITTIANDPRETVRKKLDSTGNVVLVDTAAKEVKTLENLIVSCDGTATSFSLYIRDNGVDYPVVNAFPVPANDVFPKDGTLIPHIKIAAGQQLRVEASAADHLCVVATIISSLPKRDSPAVAVAAGR